jgi:hypothetical protein
MLGPSKTVIEDTWEWLRAALMLRAWSWLISPGHFGFVGVDNQFGNSPFYSGAAWVVFLADVWLAHFAFLSFPDFVREIGNVVCKYMWVSFSPWGLCGNRYNVFFDNRNCGGDPHSDSQFH